MRPHLDTRGRGPDWLAPLAVALIWGVNVPVMKGALGRVDPFAFNALRLTTSALVLGLTDRLERRGRPAPPAPWAAIVGLGILTSLLYQVLFIQGIAHTSATHAGFLISTSPLWTAAIARLSGLERIAGRAWLGLGLGFAGTCVLVVARGGGGTATPGGNALLLAAMVVWALGAVLSRPVLSSFPATRLAFLFTCVALPGHWLLAGRALLEIGRNPLGVGTGGWLAVLYSGALSTGLAYSLWNRSVHRIGPARTSAYTTNLVPLLSLGIAWATLGERPGPVQLGGGALVLVGLALWRATRRAT